MLDELQKQLNRIVGSTLNASLEPLGHWWNKPANFFSLGITLLNCHLNRLNRIHFLILVGGPLFYSHRLSVTIAICYKDVYVSSFFSLHSPTLEFIAYRMLSFDLWLNRVFCTYFSVFGPPISRKKGPLKLLRSAGQEGSMSIFQKVSYQFFSKTVHRICLNIYMKLEGRKSKKLTQLNFSEKFLFCGNSPKIPPK